MRNGTGTRAAVLAVALVVVGGIVGAVHARVDVRIGDATKIRPNATIQEDDPNWDCRVDGNRRCGPVRIGDALRIGTITTAELDARGIAAVRVRDDGCIIGFVGNDGNAIPAPGSTC